MEALFNHELAKINEGHVFYRFQDEEIYLNNLISFICTGIDQKQQILIIENIRNLPKIGTRISGQFSADQRVYKYYYH